MQIKVIEVRDRATFIPAFAFRPLPVNPGQRYLLRRSGYSCSPSDGLVVFGYLRTGKCEYSPHDWPVSTRTMREAHKFVEKHFEELLDGDVVDVEFILKETIHPKESERYNHEL